MPKTMFEKIWEAHVVREAEGQPALLYIDLHLVHEVTSPQAFDGLRLTGRKVRRPELTVATMDHNVPTTDRSLPIADQISRKQMDTLAPNCAEFGITLYDIHDRRQGIVHVIGPELGLTQPGMTIVCGDSHTSTHGAFGALAFGIGTSEVEHVLATQCLPQSRPKTMEIRVNGQLGRGRHGQRHHSRHHRQDRHGRRDRVRRGVYRRGDPRAFDGRPHDGLQHEHRGGRARRHDRARRENVRLSARPPFCAAGRGVGSRSRRVAVAPHRPGRDV